MDDDELTYELSLAKASEWQQKAREATSPVLKQALDAVERDYIQPAAQLRSRQVAAARH
jgi:hypothetical protein